LDAPNQVVSAFSSSTRAGLNQADHRHLATIKYLTTDAPAALRQIAENIHKFVWFEHL